MTDVLENLKENQILHHQNVIDIKLGISKKYPDYSPKHAAMLFASTVHKVLDKNISIFDADARHHIKTNLLAAVVKKETFEINAFDVFEVCSTLELTDEHYDENLTDWVNHNQPETLSREQVLELANELKTYPIIEIAQTAAAETAITVQTPAAFKDFTDFLMIQKHQLLIYKAAAILFCFFVLMQSVYYFSIKTHQPSFVKREMMFDSTYVLDRKIIQYSSIQKKLRYKKIDQSALSTWLAKKNSMLAEEPYFSSIMAAAKEYDINPLLMFAITGQEQSFVPKSNPYALRIANNPFNVYGSWKDFNTNIMDTSRIAARTIVHLSEDCPPNEDPIKWLNEKYAEDPNWHIGVSQIFTDLEKATAAD